LPDATRVRLTYDGFGRRIRKQIVPPLPEMTDGELPKELPPTRTVTYFWEGDRVIGELDSERGDRFFLHDPVPESMVPLLQEQGGETYAVVTDHLGKPTELIWPNGRLAWSGLHTAWGRVVSSESETDAAVQPAMRLLGQYADDESGLCYVRNRYFDPRHARFLSPDPVELGGGTNLFGFNGNPTTHVDPLGLSCIILGDPRTDAYINQIMQHIAAHGTPANTLEVAVHGSSTGVAAQDAAGRWTNMTPQQLTQRLQDSGHYSGEPTIHMYSCNTGRTPTAVGSQVSSAFPGTTVYAPNDLVWGHGQAIGPMQGQGPRNEYMPSNGASTAYDPTRPGSWNSYQNGAGGPSNVYRPSSTYTPPGYTGP
jgi:RHS repeat-associated protein